MVRSKTGNEVVDLIKELMQTSERQHHESIENLKETLKSNERQQHEAIEDVKELIDELKKEIAEQKKNIDEQRQQIDAQTKSIEKLEDKVTYFSTYINETVQPTIQFLTDIKFKGASIICVLGFIFTTLTYYIWAYWEKIVKFLNAIK